MASSTQQTPLIQNPNSSPELDQSITKLSSLLSHLGFSQHSISRTILSWLTFFLLAIALPLFSVYYSPCSSCDTFDIEAFEFDIIVSRALVAAVSLLCISHILRKYGLRKALFVTRCLPQFSELYTQKIRVFYCLLGSWFGICLLIKAAREVIRLIYLHHEHDSWWWSLGLFSACILSWSYTTLVFVVGCGLFNLVGSLQVIHFENYGKLLEGELDVSVFIEEHRNLTHDISKISHRFRIFLLLEFFIVTGSQIMTLLRTTENQSIINLINGGDFAVLSIVQFVGILLCLTAATKISHRAQSLGSVASRWHALVTCNSNGAAGQGGNGGNSDFSRQSGSIPVNYSESDLESADYIPLPTNMQLTSVTASYRRRQAFVEYVLSNAGGFTVFGWMVDRMLMNTIFFLELSLAFFVLGKTITITIR